MGKQQKRRTPEEVAAEREEKQKAIEEKIRQLEDAKRCLAEMNVSEDIQDDEMDEENPQRLSAAVHKRTHAELDSEGDEEAFDFGEVDAMADSSESDIKPEPVKPKVIDSSNVM